MGTDIRIFVERRCEKGWEPVAPPSLWGPPGSLRWPFGRCYESFALLSGARDPNGRIIPASPPRGLPPDLSEKVRAEAVSLRLVHESWLSATELLSANLDQAVAYDGYVTVQGFREFLDVGRPTTWTRMPPRPDEQEVSPEEMRRVLERWKPGDRAYCTWIEWTQPLRLLCTSLLEFQELLRRAGDPRELRVIIGYDYL